MPSVSLPKTKAVACLQCSLISRYAISLELPRVFDLAMSVASEILCSKSVFKASMSDSHRIIGHLNIAPALAFMTNGPNSAVPRLGMTTAVIPAAAADRSDA